MKIIDRIGIAIFALAFGFWFLTIAAGQITKPTGPQIEGSLELAAFTALIIWAPLKLIGWLFKG